MTNLNEQTYVVAKMAKLIEQEVTGTSKEFCKSLKISRSLLFLILDDWKSRGVEISYSRIKRTFCFSGSKKITVNEPIQVIDKNEMVNFTGGTTDYFHFIQYPRQYQVNFIASNNYVI